MDFSFSSDQQDLRELAAKILSDATTLERTKQVVADERRLRPRPVGCARRGRHHRHLAARVGRRRRARLPRDVHRARRGRSHRRADPRARGDGARRAGARRVRRHRRARRRGRRHDASSPPPSPKRWATRTSPSTSATGGKLTGEKVCVPAGLDAKAIVVSAIDGLYLVDPSAVGRDRRARRHDARRADGASGAARRRGHQARRPRGPHLAARAGADRDSRVTMSGAATDRARPHRDVREGARAVRSRDRHVPGREPARRPTPTSTRKRSSSPRGRRRGGSTPACPRRHRSTRRSTGPRRAGRTCSSPRTTCTVVSASTATTRCTATSCWRSSSSSTWAPRRPRCAPGRAHRRHADG